MFTRCEHCGNLTETLHLKCKTCGGDKSSTCIKDYEVEIDRLRSELAAMCENHQAAVAHYRKRDAELAAKDARIAELEGLLKRARDHIGSMPAIKPDGRDCFFATLKLINEVEQTLGIA